MLRLPFVARDDVRGGMAFTEGAWGDEMRRLPSAEEAVETLLQVVEALLARGVTCIVEYVVRSRRPADLDRILAAGDCVVIVTTCAEAPSRVIERNLADRFVAAPAVLAATGFDSVADHTADAVLRMERVERDMRRDFPLPVLVVDTTTGWHPDLDRIAAFATAGRRDPATG
jgi:hypothetical protein